MAFKSKQKNLTFSDLEKSSNKKNRSLETLKNMEKVIAWDKIESILMKDYPVGQKTEGNKAYNPLLLFKCLLLQKWFQVKSDPELESQINDRHSFQSFLGLSANQSSPDHSTFSKFRKRLTKSKFDAIVGDILNQFSNQGFTINEGVAIDARIVKSASRPLSKKQLKEHAAVDTNTGLALTTVLSPASVHDTKYFMYCTLYSRHTKHPLAIVYADKGYAGAPNREFLSMNKFKDGIMRKDSTTAKLTDFEIERNKKISKVRYIVEQYFGLSHLHDDGQQARFTTIAKNNIDIWFRQVAFNMKRGFKLTQGVSTA